MGSAINAKLIAALQTKLGLRRAAVYSRISRRATELSVSNQVGALAVAQAAGLPINRYGSAEQIAELRHARAGQPTAASVAAVEPRSRRGGEKPAPKKARAPSKNVFVVHGRNHAIRKSMFEFLRSIGLAPLEWSTAMRATGSAAPYIGEILEKAFQKATAVVVLLTPDDEAQLKRQYWSRHDDAWEKRSTGQARPNVLFEAGMAFGSHPKATVLVEVGKCRPFSDTYGRHVVKLNNSESKRQELIDKLETARCPVVRADNSWLTAGDFELRNGK